MSSLIGTVRIEAIPDYNAPGDRYIEETLVTLRCIIEGLRPTDRRTIAWTRSGSSAVFSNRDQIEYVLCLNIVVCMFVMREINPGLPFTFYIEAIYHKQVDKAE